jgi:uncharacterized membrane protein YhaH (DUF805 family)
MGWYVKVLKQYAVFSGRASRKEYWMFMLINLIIWLVLPFINGIIRGVLSYGQHQHPTHKYLLGIIYGLGVIIPAIAVGVRRLHDTNRSGWLVLLGMIPVALLVYPIINEPQGLGMVLCLLLIPFVGALILLIFYVQNSQPGENQYGPNPKGITG